METPLIKNLYKYKNVRINYAKQLHDAARLRGTMVYRVDGGYFKTHEGFNDEHLLFKNLRVANEVICYHLSRDLGLKCAKYSPAYIVEKKIFKTKGSFSETVQGENETLYTAADFIGYDSNIKEFFRQLDKFCAKNHFAYDRHEMLKSIFKLVLFDTLTLQTDRNANNIYFIEKNGIITLAPLIDNEAAFFIFPGIFNTDKLKLLQNNFDKYITPAVITFGNEPNKDYRDMVKNLVNFCYKRPEFMDILKEFMDNINVSRAAGKAASDGVSVPKDYVEYMKSCVNYAKDVIYSEMEKIDSFER